MVFWECGRQTICCNSVNVCAFVAGKQATNTFIPLSNFFGSRRKHSLANMILQVAYSDHRSEQTLFFFQGECSNNHNHVSESTAFLQKNMKTLTLRKEKKEDMHIAPVYNLHPRF